MRRRVGELVARLRAHGVRVSVAETLDAFAALAVVGFDREPMREALAATLVKDISGRAAFDAAFAATFPPAPRAAAGETPAPAREGVAGGGGGEGESFAERPPREEPREEGEGRGERQPSESEDAAPGEERRGERPSATREPRDESRRTPVAARSQDEAHAASVRKLARQAELGRMPFRAMQPSDVPEVRDLAEALAKRIARRRSRRLRQARRGRPDLRASLRRAVSTGGLAFRLVRRTRRPRRPSLVALVDLSWSTRLASEMLLWDPLESTCRHASLSIL